MTSGIMWMTHSLFKSFKRRTNNIHLKFQFSRKPTDTKFNSNSPGCKKIYHTIIWNNNCSDPNKSHEEKEPIRSALAEMSITATSVKISKITRETVPTNITIT